MKPWPFLLCWSRDYSPGTWPAFSRLSRPLQLQWIHLSCPSCWAIVSPYSQRANTGVKTLVFHAVTLVWSTALHMVSEQRIKNSSWASLGDPNPLCITAPPQVTFLIKVNIRVFFDLDCHDSHMGITFIFYQGSRGPDWGSDLQKVLPLSNIYCGLRLSAVFLERHQITACFFRVCFMPIAVWWCESQVDRAVTLFTLVPISSLVQCLLQSRKSVGFAGGNWYVWFLRRSAPFFLAFCNAFSAGFKHFSLLINGLDLPALHTCLPISFSGANHGAEELCWPCVAWTGGL